MDGPHPGGSTVQQVAEFAIASEAFFQGKYADIDVLVAALGQVAEIFG